MNRGWWDERRRRIIQIVNGKRIHISSVFRAPNAIDKKYVARFRLSLYSAARVSGNAMKLAQLVYCASELKHTAKQQLCERTTKN